jgi:exosortase A
MHAESFSVFAPDRARALRPQLAFVVVTACVAGVLGLFASTFLEMANIWTRSGTFNHGWAVLPLFLYLAWQRRFGLAGEPMRPSLLAIPLAAGAGLVWLLAELSSALTPAFFAIIAMVPLAILGVCGRRWVGALAFPLAFLFFAVPFGEVLVPTLMEWTADFTVLALRASGIPVYREGQNFVIPSGSWSVVEACSGIRYLIASVFVGVLYAWTMYRSALRRTLFIAASAVVPIVANWLRAFLIVLLGHLSDNRIATGVDHLIYGWVFFGIVMAVLFAVGAIWREDVSAVPASPVADAGPVSTWLDGDRRRAMLVALGLIAVLAIWPVAKVAALAAVSERPVAEVQIQSVSEWKRQPGSVTSWRPHLEGATSQQSLTFSNGDRRIGVFLGLFRAQRQGAELVNQMNQLVHSSDAVWRLVAQGERSVALGDRSIAVRTALLRSAQGGLVAWQWYWLGGGTVTGSDTVAKLDLAVDRLLGRDDTSAWITVYAEYQDDPSTAEVLLGSFVGDMSAAMDAALAEVARQ